MGWLRSHLGGLERKKNLAGDLSENCPYIFIYFLQVPNYEEYITIG